MAHSCPECGLACHCGGDIDDCLFDNDEFVNQCTCCPDERGGSDDDFDYDDDDVPRCPECDACITQGDAHDSECPYA